MQIISLDIYINQYLLKGNEQYTTYVATEELYEVGLSHEQVKKSKDQVSAYLIVQSYLQQQKKSNPQ